MSQHKPKRAKQRVTDRDPEAYAAGAQASINGQPLRANPYPKGTTSHREWSRGFRSGERYRGDG